MAKEIQAKNCNNYENDEKNKSFMDKANFIKFFPGRFNLYKLKELFSIYINTAFSVIEKIQA
tara:strand:+ start:104 stop:289 length:186 start_codon:yes stop_codon:yes gene_type:complete